MNTKVKTKYLRKYDEVIIKNIINISPGKQWVNRMNKKCICNIELIILRDLIQLFITQK